MAGISTSKQERLRELKGQLSKMEEALKVSDEAYIKNKRILADAFSDEELRQLVLSGERTQAEVDEYIDQRKALELLVYNEPQLRKTTVNFISNIKVQIYDLEREIAVELKQARKSRWKSVCTCIGATAAYWVVLFLGPAIVLIFNNLGYYVSGAGWGPGSLMYKILQFLSQPLSCFFAYSVADSITKGRFKGWIWFNCLLGGAMCVLFILTAETVLLRYAMALSALTCVASALFDAFGKK